MRAHSAKVSGTLSMVFCALAVLVPLPAAHGQQGTGRPRIVIDETGTPLQKMIEKWADGKKQKEMEGNAECKAATEAGDPKEIKKKCKFPGKDVKPLATQEMKNRQGKVNGKKLAAEMTLDFQDPRSKDKDAWDPVRFKKMDKDGQSRATGADPRPGGGVRVRRAALFTGPESNDDKDCIDTLTGEHRGGYLDAASPATPANLIPDGDPRSCFEADGTLKAGVEELVDEDAPEAVDDDGDGATGEDPPGDAVNNDHDCIDAGGTVYPEAQCGSQPGVVELIDEDGPETIDHDGDGRVGEDPPAESVEAACHDFGVGMGLPPGLGEMTPDGECDLTRAVVAAVNEAAMKKMGKKVLRSGGDGEEDLLELDQTRRRTKLKETLTVRCDEEAELVAGECMEPAAKTRELAAAKAASSAKASGAPFTRNAMMGFTFAPPVIEWGYEVSEEVCIDLVVDEFCFEIFGARVGYEFDVAVGLRLPVEVSVTDVPSSALAGSQLTLHTELQPQDFTVGDYKAFCQEHHLDDEWFIASCDRFAFPEFLDSLNPFKSADEKDGAELVAAETIFAGVQVRVVGATIINWAVDSHVDLPAMCTLYHLVKKINEGDVSLKDMVQFGIGVGSGGNVLDAIKDQLDNCQSFTTPFGSEPDPDNPLLSTIRAFPFSGSYDIRADCDVARVKKEVVTIGGKVYPICTGLVLGVSGANLGVGLGFEVSAGSDLIAASWDVSGDGRPALGGERTVRYRHSADEGAAGLVELGPVKADNYDPAPFADNASVSLSNMTYYLNQVQLALRASFQFGGILSPIPEIGSFTLYNFTFSVDEHGIPIGQHAGTENIEVPFFVENYALKVDASPLTTDPELRVSDDTLRIKPGEFGDFKVDVTNLGSVTDDFGNFARALSNRSGQHAPFTFEIHPNTDFDCTDGTGARFRGDPYDGVMDACYGAGGELLAGRTEAIDEDGAGPDGVLSVRDEDKDGWPDEDPVDVWLTSPDAALFAQQEIPAVPPYKRASEPPASRTLTLRVSPFRHPLTEPGLYPVQVSGDSLGARARGLLGPDASGQPRVGATDVVFIEVTAFYDPYVAVQPDRSAAKPGVVRTYLLEAANGGNAEDTVRLGLDFKDFNPAGCTLTTLGALPAGCPYRAVPTRIPAAQWTTAAGLPLEAGPMAPLDTLQNQLTVRVPRDWAGMQDTSYEFVFSGESTADPGQPPAHKAVTVRQTVVATQESMTRYIRLEIAELIAEIEKANAKGIQTGGLLPISLHPARMHNDRALERNLAGDLAGASREHAAGGKAMQAFLRALAGFGGKLPAALMADWKARGEAIVKDQAVAEASRVASAP